MPQGMYILGKPAGSINEYNVSIALNQMRLTYWYQYAPWGYQSRGAFVIDFVVQTPFNAPLEVYGDYWHKGQLSEGDRLRDQIIADYFKVPEVLLIWGRDSEDVPTAKMHLRRLLGV